jgi:AcrR family transcriptional regulator
VGSAERRSRERADTRQRILDAAREMFVREGFEATTMRAIAQRIEYTPTAIYHHFANKHALLTELCTLDFRALAGAFQRIGRIDDPLARLSRIGAAYVDFGLEHPMQYQLLFMARRPEVPPEACAPADDPGEDAYSFLRDTCAEAIVSGRMLPECDDPEELAQMCWGSLHGLVALHIAMGEDAFIDWRDVRATATRMSAALMRGLMRRPTH